jgi:hypothetical protein
VSLVASPRAQDRVRAAALYNLRLRAVASSASLHRPSMISERPITHLSESFRHTPSSSFILISAIWA